MDVNESLDAERVADLLGLQPLPGEGGRWAQTVRDGYSTAIYYLLSEGDFSAMHRLKAPELYHHYAGAPARLLLLHPEGKVTESILGSDLQSDERPQILVPEGVWQGSSTQGRWSLLGTTMTPPYTDEMFELGLRRDLATGWPAAAGRIADLTRD